MTLAEEMENREYFAQKEGKAAGLKEGEKLIQEKIALKLKASGMALSEIAEITGLSEDEAAALE